MNDIKYNEKLRPCIKCGGKMQITRSRSEDCLDTGVICSKCGHSMVCIEDVWSYLPEVAVQIWNEEATP